MILDEIVAVKEEQLKAKKEKYPLKHIIGELGRLDETKIRNFKNALIKDNISIIGEIKRASPSRGIIVKHFQPEDIANMYEIVDIDAVSVLTEEHYFRGKDQYLKEVKNLISKPVLRKDFIVDEYQIYESKLLGADAILLIVRILKQNLGKFYKIASSLGLQCIVEVHNKRELDIALEIAPDIIGINNRNLENFTVDLKNTENLVKYIPGGIAIVSESGIKTMDDFKYIRSLPLNAVLIGEGFMKRIDDVSNMEEFINNIKNA
ncbi:indole-3-glycerol phosphate synthase TrpC [Clostridium sp. WILCCON 0269]|uniref:Indole-3-glycerol phosphate synthase n=1 Tax=Candidatus Clostridium eludens TaxID=3381663 RepID=A0ABW8SKF2_9CLOT